MVANAFQRVKIKGFYVTSCDRVRRINFSTFIDIQNKVCISQHFISFCLPALISQKLCDIHHIGTLNICVAVRARIACRKFYLLTTFPPTLTFLQNLIDFLCQMYNLQHCLFHTARGFRNNQNILLRAP